MRTWHSALLGLAVIGGSVIAAEGATGILASGSDDAVEKVCEIGVESVEKGGEVIVATARTAPNALRPVMECLYRNVTLEQFDAMVISAVDTLNSAGE